MLAQDVGIAPQAAPARHHFLDRLIARHQLLELGRQRLQPPAGRLRQHPTPLAIVEGAADVLEPTRQRRRVLRRHRRQCVPADFQFRHPVHRLRAAERLDLRHDGQPVGLFAGHRPGALALGVTLSLAFGNGLPHGVAGRLEPLTERGVELHVRLQLRPRQPGRRQLGRCRVRIGGHQAFDTRNQRRSRARRSSADSSIDGSGAGRDASSSCRRRVRARRDATLFRARCAIAASASGSDDTFERRDRGVSLLRLQRNVHDLLRICEAGQCAQAGRAVGRVTADRPQRFRICHQIDDRRPDSALLLSLAMTTASRLRPQCQQVAGDSRWRGRRRAPQWPVQ